jgi:tetratricopeptide (TPR) repeat protein
MLRTERARIVMKSDPARAIDLFREILAEDPAHPEASAFLAELLEKAGRIDELIAILTQKLETAKDREDAPSVLALSMKLGALLEQRDDESGALDLYHGVLDWDGTNLPALRAIVRLGLKREDSIDLGNALDKLLTVEVGDEAVELALHLSAIRGAHGDALGAEQALEAGYAASPTHTRLRERLIESYTARESWQKLADLYTQEAGRREDKAERVEHLCLAAEVLRERAHDVPGAAQVLERALEIDATDRDVLLALIDAYDALGEHGRAARAISVAIDVTPDDPWLYRSRALHREAVGLHDEALADIERAYEMTSGAYATELVEQLERAVGRAAEDVSALGDWESPPTTESPQRALRLRLVEVLRKAGEIDRARDHLGEILRLNDKDKEALRLLASVEEGAQRWDAAGAAFGKLLSLEEGDELVAAALRLADMCERAGSPADARPGLEQALRAVPESAPLRDRLRALYTSLGATRELAGLILEDAAIAPDVAGKHALMLQAGRLLLTSHDDAEQAAQVFEDARALRSDDQETTLLLAQARAASGDIAAARAVLGQLIAAHKGRRSKQLAAVYLRLSRIEDAEGNLSEALTALAKAFEMDPGSGSLAMDLGLKAIDLCEYEIASRAFRSVTMMKAAPAGSTEGITPASRALAYYHLGDIAKSQGDVRKARLMVEKAVSEDPSLEKARSLLEELRGG